ncbi:family 10 glycosylhydrolase [Leptolyngbya sp. FACHB-36]|uniref:glycoside hydrolase family 10 protein n=1 Tax=Leptolyngbya sp. FACHB-36 TaxID=2692808 RepID=UPI00168104FF|nr:family 10 glycosylhydrolase [Leptolyngbya sp. FACHB-36]MBD2022276.1 family 10 glycosylhydrolase [Leptolyngbya sp. FACHB-36]
MVGSSARFSDIQAHWARSFIESLAQRNIVRGFPDQTFRPNRAVTRAEFAVLVQTAFARPPKRPNVPFVDVPANYWAANAIRQAYEAGFLSGYPDRSFRPDETVTRAQVLVALVSGLGITATRSIPLAEVYQDSAQIPSFATNAIAAATDTELVVNFPTWQLLRPQQAATRAEVATSIYQTLVHLEQAPPIASEAIVRWLQTVRVSHTREFRAVWVTTVWNRDWTSKPGLPAAQQQAEFIALLNQMQALNLNALILQVRPEGDALYASSLEPWSHWLTGQQGKPPEPFYDPLEFAINQCHQRGIELHAWFNPYRARSTPQTVNAPSHIAVTNPDVVYEWGNQLWMDPGASRVQERTYRVILDVVRRYDVDGIHLDDYFYPYPIAGKSFPDDKTYQAYQASGGTLPRADWRRENVNQLIQRLAAGIRAEKPFVKFGISPFGIYRPGQPEPIRGLDAYDQLYADSLKWLQQGWMDYLTPQLYWKIDAPAQSYPVLLNWWLANNPKQRHVYIGNNIALLNGKDRDVTEIERQVDLTRQQRDRFALGNIFYSMETFSINRQGVSDRFQTAIYRDPVLAPVIPWLTLSTPTPPTRVRARDGKLTWSVATPDIRAWTLYQKQNDRWTLRQILPAKTTTAAVPSGTYALCAVNRLAAESLGVVVSVTS